MSPSRCASPVPLEALVDYWSGAASAADEEALEDHVFDCASCGGRLAGVARLARGISKVAARRGGLQMVVTKSIIDRLEADGVRMRHYRVAPGQITPCTIGAEDDLLVTYLSGDLQGVQRADVVLQDAGGRPLMHIEDAPIDAIENNVIYTVGGDVARTFPAMTIRVQLVAVEPGGTRTIAQYTFEHSPGG